MDDAHKRETSGKGVRTIKSDGRRRSLERQGKRSVVVRGRWFAPSVCLARLSFYEFLAMKRLILSLILTHRGFLLTATLDGTFLTLRPLTKKR